MSRTRIGIYGLVRSHLGSVELPAEITMHCPQCGTPCADIGNCLLQLRPCPDPELKRHVVRLEVDCRVCGCDGEAPLMPEDW